MRLGSLEIRPFSPADDIKAELDLSIRAFGPISAARRPGWAASVQASVDARQIFGVFDGTRLVASARYHPMRQWWNGRSLPMAGVAGVKVAPEERGRGVGRAMMSVLLTEMAAQGSALSVLFPTIAPLYRAAGWEFAGGLYEAVLPSHALRALTPAAGHDATAVKFRRATPADDAAVVEVLDRVHQSLRNCGPNTREPAAMTRWLDDEDHFTYLADDGFLSYRWVNGHDQVDVQVLAAASAATARAFWHIVASHATMADRVRARVAPDDAVTWLTKDPAAEIKRRETWMLRVIDAEGAIAGRGFPSGMSLAVPLEIADESLPANDGNWMLEVADGQARLARSDNRAGSALKLGIRGFSALYAGVRLSTLRLAGLASGGDPADDASLDSAFGGPAFMIDYF